MSFSSEILFPELLDYKNNGYASFEDEISQVCNYVMKAHNCLLVRVWVPCNQNPGCRGKSSDHVSPNRSVYVLQEQETNLTYPDIHLLKWDPHILHLLQGQGIVGQALLSNRPVSSTSIASSSKKEDSLSRYSGTDRLRAAAVAIPLKSNHYNKGCILECLLPLECTDPEELKKILTALFSTLKLCCKTSYVVSDELINEIGSLPSPAIQPPKPLDAVKQSGDIGSLFSKENSRKANQSSEMLYLTDLSGQKEKCPKPTPSFEAAEWLDVMLDLAGIEGECMSFSQQHLHQRLSDEELQEFEDEITKILDSALKKHGLPLALAWVPCILNRLCSFGQLAHEDNVSVLYGQEKDSIIHLPSFNLHLPSTHEKKGIGIIGKPFMDKKAFFSPSIASSFNKTDPLYRKVTGVEPHTALVTIPLKSKIHTGECVLEFYLPSDCRELEEQKKILIALFSTLNQSCKTSFVVADKVVDEQNNPLFLGFPSVANDSSVPKVKPIEDHPKQVWQFFPESSDQNEKRPDPTSRIEPADIRNAIGLCSLAASETSEARPPTVGKTVNVPNTSPNNFAKSTGGKSTGGAKRKRHWAWDHCTENPDNKNGVICSFCEKKLESGGITRFVSHISGSDPSKNVTKCKKVPRELKAKIRKMVKKRR